LNLLSLKPKQLKMKRFKNSEKYSSILLYKNKKQRVRERNRERK
jgi:hypothetical protein